MREKYGFKHPLSPAETPKIVLSVLGKEIDAFLAEKQQRERPRSELDLSKLRGIRQAAAVTREKPVSYTHLNGIVIIAVRRGGYDFKNVGIGLALNGFGDIFGVARPRKVNDQCVGACFGGRERRIRAARAFAGRGRIVCPA